MDGITFKGRTALITGAGQGLGKSYASLLAKHGASVIINDIAADGKKQKLSDKVTNEINAAGGTAYADYHDVTDNNQVKQMVEDSLRYNGKIDILIHNAGIIDSCPITDLDEERWNKVNDVHVKSLYYLLKEIMPHMAENHYGRIVGISSTTALYGLSNQISYGSAKMGLIGLLKSVSKEVYDHNVLCNIVMPLAFTQMTESSTSYEMLPQLKVEQVSPLVAYLCSENCTVTDGVYLASGGYYTRLSLLMGKGVYIDNDITIDAIEENFPSIQSMFGAKEVLTLSSMTKEYFKKVKKGKQERNKE